MMPLGRVREACPRKFEVMEKKKKVRCENGSNPSVGWQV
jgi:hypothetical protein